jgi:hypothetical protein
VHAAPTLAEGTLLGLPLPKNERQASTRHSPSTIKADGPTSSLANQEIKPTKKSKASRASSGAAAGKAPAVATTKDAAAASANTTALTTPTTATYTTNPTGTKQSQRRSGSITTPPSVLDAEQSDRLSAAIGKQLQIVDRYQRSVVSVAPGQLVNAVRCALDTANINVCEVKLEGSAASHVLNATAVPSYGDLDFVFHLHPNTDRRALESIRRVVSRVLIAAGRREQASATSSPESSPPTPCATSPVPAVELVLGQRAVVAAQGAPAPAPAPPSTTTTHYAHTSTGASPVVNGYPFGAESTSAAAQAFADQDHEHALFQKQFITTDTADGDAWAVYSLAAHPTMTNPAVAIDLKFVKRIARPFEFTADSFQLILKQDAVWGNPPPGWGNPPRASTAVAASAANHSALSVSAVTGSVGAAGAAGRESEVVDPTSSMSNNLATEFTSSAANLNGAVRDLDEKWISVQGESDLALIRGGGLMKFARFLARGWRVGPGLNQRKMYRYMVTRFMVDFPPFQMSRYGARASFLFVTETVGCRGCNSRSHLYIVLGSEARARAMQSKCLSVVVLSLIISTFSRRFHAEDLVVQHLNRPCATSSSRMCQCTTINCGCKCFKRWCE